MGRGVPVITELTEASSGQAFRRGPRDFGSVRFTQVKVTDLNQTGASAMVNSQWTTYKITEYGTVTIRPEEDYSGTSFGALIVQDRLGRSFRTVAGVLLLIDSFAEVLT